VSEEGAGVRHLVVTINKSRTLRFDKPFASAVVGAPDIVDALPMSDRVLYIQGKKVGTSNVSVFDQGMKLIGVLDVEVAIDTGNLQQKIRSVTGSRGIRAAAATARSCVAASLERGSSRARRRPRATGGLPSETLGPFQRASFSPKQIPYLRRVLDAGRGHGSGCRWRLFRWAHGRGWQ
jgi:pilus assembly protein CpaC